MKYRYTMERQIHFATNWRTSSTLMFGRVGWIEDHRFVPSVAPEEQAPVVQSAVPSEEELRAKLPFHLRTSQRIHRSE
ncbi:MAG: hypothetical protein U0136_14475 [Bdellovibrionota bacterium]